MRDRWVDRHCERNAAVCCGKLLSSLAESKRIVELSLLRDPYPQQEVICDIAGIDLI